MHGNDIANPPDGFRETMETSLRSIHPMTLRVDSTPSCNIYNTDGAGAVVLFHEGGVVYSAEDHGRLFYEPPESLHVRTEDYPRYLEYLEGQFDEVIEDPFLSPPDKADVIHGLLSYLAMLLLDGPTEGLIRRYKRVVALTARFVLDEDRAIEYLIGKTRSSFHDYNHLVNVGIYAMGLARDRLKESSDEDTSEVAASFFLHDIGRCAIPKHIIGKNGPLSDAEWEMVRRHPEEGVRILKQCGMATEKVVGVVLQHHERHDGHGYPLGLKGVEIHTDSKICTIADAFDALTSHRPYRPAHTSFKALQIMHHEMQREFDPSLFGRFVLLFSTNAGMSIRR